MDVLVQRCDLACAGVTGVVQSRMGVACVLARMSWRRWHLGLRLTHVPCSELCITGASHGTKSDGLGRRFLRFSQCRLRHCHGTSTCSYRSAQLSDQSGPVAVADLDLDLESICGLIPRYMFANTP